MTIPPNAPKNSGLSRLADTALEIEAERARQDGIQILTSYPVKRKGEPRRLVPNQAGIEWLESDHNHFDGCTEIYDWDHRQSAENGLCYFSAVGAVNHTYTRPMFEILDRNAFHTAPQKIQGADTCCYDFHLTWKCETHPEVPYDHKRKVWLNAAQLDIDARTDEALDAAAAIAEAYDRLGRALSGCQDEGRVLPDTLRSAPGVQISTADLNQPLGHIQRLTLTGTFNDDAIRPILGTDNSQAAGYWTLTVEGETEQASILGNGSSQAFEMEVERNG